MLWGRTVTAGTATPYLTPPHIRTMDRAVTDTLRGTDGIRRLLVMMPPRHGKSEYCSRFLPSWYLGAYRTKRVILASYNDTFATEWGRRTRNLLEEHGHYWGVSVDQGSHAMDRWSIAGTDGGMVAVGAGGTLTGRGADLLIVDDPIKDHVEAHSQLIRDRVWDWWVSTAYTRLEPQGAAIVIQTRWHLDDLAGRLLQRMADGGEQWRVLQLPAIGSDGAALWPERFPLATLETIRKQQGSYYWSALYQQSPIPDGGGQFKVERVQIVKELPKGCRRAVRYWDTANSADGDYTVGALLTEHAGTFYVADVVRGQWTWKQRNEVMRQTAERDKLDWHDLQLWVEAQRGDAGGVVGDLFTRDFAKFALRLDRPTQSKELRARPLEAQIEAGNVVIVRAKWNGDYLGELRTFPHGQHDDQVDATSGAFNHLVGSASTGLTGRPRAVMLGGA